MQNINKNNTEVYNLYYKYAEKFKNNFKAGGYSLFSSWGLRKSLIDHMAHLFDCSKIDILDVGCNNGLMGREFCNSLNRRNIETVIDGIDFVEEATLIAKKEFNYRSTFVADVTDEQAVNNLLGMRQYPVIFCCEVFLLLNPKDYKSFFSTIYSHLNPDGYFLFVIPNIKSIYHLTNKLIATKSFKYYFKYDYDLPLVHSLLQKYQFDVIAIFGATPLINLKINLSNYNNKIKNLFSSEIAILAKK